MDIQREALVGEIARLEQALGEEHDALRRAVNRHWRQALRLNVAAAHEALGDLYRRLHARDAAGPAADTVLYIIEPPPHAGEAR